MAVLTGPFDVPQKVGDEIRIQAAAVKNYRGGAAAVVMGTGYARPLLVGTDGHQFIGVYLETNDNSAGVAGTIVYDPLNLKSSFVRIARSGIFAFTQTGITQASVGLPCWFSDDQTVTTTPGAVSAGIIVAIDEQNSKAWVDISNAVRPIRGGGLQVISADGAVAPRTPATYVVTKAGVAAMTLAAPTATTDDGLIICITSNTANAHTLTATGLFQCGTASVNLATFAAQKGAGLTIMAYQGKWNVLSSVGITFS